MLRQLTLGSVFAVDVKGESWPHTVDGKLVDDGCLPLPNDLRGNCAIGGWAILRGDCAVGCLPAL